MSKREKKSHELKRNPHEVEEKRKNPQPLSNSAKSLTPPHPQLLHLIAAFLTQYDLLSTCRELRVETRKRFQGKGWPDNEDAQLDEPLPSLTKLFDDWRKQKEEERVKIAEKTENRVSAKLNGKGTITRIESDDVTSSDESDESTSDESESDNDVVPPKKGTLAGGNEQQSRSAATSILKRAEDVNMGKRTQSWSSESDSDSSTTSSEDDTQDSAMANFDYIHPQPDTSSPSDSSSDSDLDVQVRKGKSEQVTPGKVSSRSNATGVVEHNKKDITAYKKSSTDASSSTSTSDSSDSDSEAVSPITTKEQPAVSNMKRKRSPERAVNGGTNQAKKARQSFAESTQVGRNSKPQNKPFSRIPVDVQVDKRFGSNAYVPYDYAERAHKDLSVTKGKSFTKEKNKKKRGSYRGGTIDINGKKGIKFD